MKRLNLLIAAISCLVLFGCGQSGPLYLPGNPSEIRSAPQPVQDADEKEDEDEDDGR
ncbi:MAG TPA: lipoprotein [Woeseiaceae bacterium]|nr:lipoprotein [Woeseiaceae bacterium]